MTEKLKDDIWGKTRKERLQRTEERHKYLENQGFNIVVKWECEFQKERSTDKDLIKYLQRFNRPLDKKLYLNEKQILHAVENDLVFGAVEVDISVPNELIDKFE